MSTSNMQIALSLSDEEFELVLRQRLQRAFTDLTPGTSMIMLLAVTTYASNNALKEVKWKVGTSNTTEGEILTQVVTEYNRRVNFAKTCTLRLLETTAEPTIEANSHDETPF